jgi:hypothetical protein
MFNPACVVNRAYLAAALIAASVLAAGPANAAGEILITHAKALAGNVTPGDPAGYPVVITIPGTFQLASNLSVAASKIGIQVTSANVTIDFNGFTMQGSDVAWYGVTGGAENLTIKNGNITHFKFDGVSGTGEAWVIDSMRISRNGRDGVRVGNFAIIKSSIVLWNGQRGIATAFSAVIQENNVTANQRYGIYTAASSVVGNVINTNGWEGLSGNITTGYSANTLVNNNLGGAEVFSAKPQHPNACYGTCP